MNTLYKLICNIIAQIFLWSGIQHCTQIVSTEILQKSISYVDQVSKRPSQSRIKVIEIHILILVDHQWYYVMYVALNDLNRKIGNIRLVGKNNTYIDVSAHYSSVCLCTYFWGTKWSKEVYRTGILKYTVEAYKSIQSILKQASQSGNMTKGHQVQ